MCSAGGGQPTHHPPCSSPLWGCKAWSPALLCESCSSPGSHWHSPHSSPVGTKGDSQHQNPSRAVGTLHVFVKGMPEVGPLLALLPLFDPKGETNEWKNFILKMVCFEVLRSSGTQRSLIYSISSHEYHRFRSASQAAGGKQRQSLCQAWNFFLLSPA